MLICTDETNHYRYEVDSKDKIIIRDFLKEQGFSRGVITRIRQEGKLLLNDNPVYFIDKAQPGDIIDVFLPEEKDLYCSTQGDIDIIYEDSEVLIINKQADMVVHPVDNYQENTLANRIVGYFRRTGQNVKVRFCNRLDKDTTGIVVIAKNRFVQHYIQSRMRRGEITKHYLAVVENNPDPKEDTIDLPIYRPDPESIERIVDLRGKPSQTRYKTTKKFKNAAEVECELLTGRTHQIRVHMKARGTPIIGDPLYNPDCKIPCKRQALHAYKMSLSLPKSGKHVFTAPIPPDLIELEKKLKEY